MSRLPKIERFKNEVESKYQIFVHVFPQQTRVDLFEYDFHRRAGQHSVPATTTEPSEGIQVRLVAPSPLSTHNSRLHLSCIDQQKTNL